MLHGQSSGPKPLSSERLGDYGVAILVHEVWIDSERMPGLCLVEALGNDFRELQEVGAQIVATIEASSHFEAMSKYNAMLGEAPTRPRLNWVARPTRGVARYSARCSTLPSAAAGAVADLNSTTSSR